MNVAARFRPSPVELLCLVVGAALVVHNRWLFDDAFIYFRYVDNFLFLHGGLTYNLGEYVEGYTSPGYCLLLCLLRATHADFATIVLFLGLTSYAVLWVMLVVLNGRLCPPGAFAVNLPLVLLAANYGVTSFCTSGVETVLVQVAAVGYALFVLRPRSAPLALLVAVSPLLRPELLPPLALAIGWAWWRSRRFPVVLTGTAIAINGSWLLFRVMYYADLLPNTFYLKDETDWARGLAYLRDVTGTYHVVPATLGMVILGILLWRRGDRDGTLGPLEVAPRLVMVAIAAAVTLYVVRVGGAAIHYQYLAFPFVLTTCAAAGLAERALALTRWRGRRWIEWGVALGAIALVASFRHPLVGAGIGIADPKWHRERPSLQSGTWVPLVAVEDEERFANGFRLEGYPSTKVGAWCRHNYVAFRVRMIHRFGLTDRVLAQMALPEWRRGHKPLLKGPALDILAIQKDATAIGRGMFREASEAGRAPEWVRQNLDTIEILEQKMYNRHDLFENLRLALMFPPKISLDVSAEKVDRNDEPSWPAED